uniref:Peptidase S1 domain-containing protein n=1 Tax=Salvator merianae TaxID=96440 RepID=A0A8D0BZU6_SALMN
MSYASASQNRIIGGQECPENAHPWLVLLYKSQKPYCSGLLLNHNWVITAAHCYSSEIEMRFGVHLKNAYQQLRVSVDMKCPNDNCSCFTEDIMLIQLNSPVDYTERIRPIPLPTSCASEGTTCTVMGWGTTSASEETYPDVPYCVDIEILNNQVCQAAYPWEVTDYMYCAGVLEGGKDSCKGDSGGPLVCNGELQGIVSLGGFPCAVRLEPGIYTKVYKYLDWIQSIIGESPTESDLSEG